MVHLEQRKAHRFKAPAKTIVYTEESFGQIVDISSGGFSLKYIDMETPIKKKEMVDILLGGLSLRNVPVVVVWENRSPGAHSGSIIMSSAGLKFGDLTQQQREMIDYFISQHTAGNA